MIKRLGAVLLATAIGIAPSQHAGAQSPGETATSPPAAAPAAPQDSTAQSGDRPATVEDCLKRLNAVVNEALTLNLPDDKVDKAESALATMEQSCIDQNFADASATESEIRRLLSERSNSTSDGK
jgi:hypothetical protein